MTPPPEEQSSEARLRKYALPLGELASEARLRGYALPLGELASEARLRGYSHQEIILYELFIRKEAC